MTLPTPRRHLPPQPALKGDDAAARRARGRVSLAGAIAVALAFALPLAAARAEAPGAAAHAAAAPAARETAALDRTWDRLRACRPTLASRELYAFLLEAVTQGWRPERTAEVIDLVERMHDRDPASPTYGNYRWYWHEARPDDRNAVEFCMQLAALVWTTGRETLTAEARGKLEAAMRLGAEGMLRHRVPVSYTNIFLMRLANCIVVGEALDRPDLAAAGRAWLDEWLAYTRRNGLHEYSSPTYTGVDLEDLGLLARHSADPAVRAKAREALQIVWAEVGANWFAPHGGLGGAHSRDYDFLAGHGELDGMLELAGWIPPPRRDRAPTLLCRQTFVPPPPEAAALAGRVPRLVAERWGEKPWESCVHYVGAHFSLGSAGVSYGPQDKVLVVALTGGPRRPLVNFSMDYRGDPYGRSKVMTSGSHAKLTHLVPFVASVQRGATALLLASVDPARTPNPAGRNQPMAYAGVDANIVFPSDLECWDSSGRLEPARDTALAIGAGHGLYLRDGDTAVALAFMLADGDRGSPVEVALKEDGGPAHAARLAAHLANARPQGRVSVVVWVRAAEGLDDAGFAAFRRLAEEALRSATVRRNDGVIFASIGNRGAPLTLEADPSHERRLRLEGGEPQPSTGALAVIAPPP